MLVEGLGEVSREFFREAEVNPRRAERFERDLNHFTLDPIKSAARDLEVSTKGLPTAAQIRESMGGVLRGIIYATVMNKRDIEYGFDREVNCELNELVQDAMRDIEHGLRGLGVEIREPRRWEDVQKMLI